MEVMDRRQSGLQQLSTLGCLAPVGTSCFLTAVWVSGGFHRAARMLSSFEKLCVVPQPLACPQVTLGALHTTPILVAACLATPV